MNGVLVVLVRDFGLQKSDLARCIGSGTVKFGGSSVVKLRRDLWMRKNREWARREEVEQEVYSLAEEVK